MSRIARARLTVIAVALAILLAAEGTARLVATRLPDQQEFWNDEARDKFALLDDGWPADGVVVAGSSLSFWAIDPTLLADALDLPAGFNAAVAGGFAAVQATWTLKDVVPRTRPAMVILEASPLMLNDHGEGPRSVTDRVESLGRYQEAFASQVSQAIGHRSTLWARRDDLRSPQALRRAFSTPATTDPGPPALDELRPDGFRARTDSVDDFCGRGDFCRRIWTQYLTDFSAGNGEVDRLLATAQALQTQGVRVVFFTPPVLQEDPRWPQILAETRRVASAAAASIGADYVDGSAWQARTDLFQDPVHLDVPGAAWASRCLAAALAQPERTAC